MQFWCKRIIDDLLAAQARCRTHGRIYDVPDEKLVFSRAVSSPYNPWSSFSPALDEQGYFTV